MPCYQGTGLGCPVALLTGFASKHPLVQNISKERLVFIRELETFKYPTVQIIL